MIPLSHALSLTVTLFVLGLIGIIVRRNLLFMLLGLEIIIHSAALAFVVVSMYLGQEDGQIMYMLVITIASAEAAISLALLLQLYRRYRTLDISIIDGTKR